ncbi:hypothetical protein D3C71_2092990 [compost metagenome]
MYSAKTPRSELLIRLDDDHCQNDNKSRATDLPLAINGSSPVFLDAAMALRVFEVMINPLTTRLRGWLCQSQRAKRTT